MATVSIEGNNLIVTMTGLNKLAALKNRILVPLENVRGATHDPGIVREPKGIRAPGTHVPGLVTAGTFYEAGDRVFWDVTRGEQAIVIELANDRFVRLIVSVEDPRASVDLVNHAVPRQTR